MDINYQKILACSTGLFKVLQFCMDKKQEFFMPENLDYCLDEEQVIKEFARQNETAYKYNSIYVSGDQ